VPIRLIHERWIDKYTERQVSALTDLKNQLALLVGGQMEDTGAGGGWNWVLSGLKTVLETGTSLDWQGSSPLRAETARRGPRRDGVSATGGRCMRLGLGGS
jgi:hypothetical protein